MFVSTDDQFETVLMKHIAVGVLQFRIGERRQDCASLAIGLEKSVAEVFEKLEVHCVRSIRFSTIFNGARIAAIRFCRARSWIFFELRFDFTSKHGIRGSAVGSAGAVGRLLISQPQHKQHDMFYSCASPRPERSSAVMRPR
jgi:hypothetical protein